MLTKQIYDITCNIKFKKDFELLKQIRKATISISSNIVEGFEKNNNNEFVRYLKIAKGSVGEVRNQLYIAFAVNYVEKSQFNKINQSFELLSNKIGKLISYLRDKKSKKEFSNT